MHYIGKQSTHYRVSGARYHDRRLKHAGACAAWRVHRSGVLPRQHDPDDCRSPYVAVVSEKTAQRSVNSFVWGEYYFLESLNNAKL